MNAPGADVDRGADAYGQILMARLEGRAAYEIMERDDGVVWADSADDYFAPFRAWPPLERRAMRLVRGRVLDVGCGAGRISLHLQERGRDVVAIDASPLAVEVARRRGVAHARVAVLADLPDDLGVFDTVVIARNNLGLGGAGADRARLLEMLARRTSPRGRIVTDSVDPSRLPPDRRPEGDRRYRVRWMGYRSPWWRYEMLRPEDAASMTEGSPWTVRRVLDDGSPRWIAVLEKRPA